AGRRPGREARSRERRPADVRAAGYRDVPVPADRSRGRDRGRHGAVHAQCGQRDRRDRLSRAPARVSRHPAGDRRNTRVGRQPAGAELRGPVRGRRGGPERGDGPARPAGGGHVTWLLAAVGILMLVFLHELGHFTAAKLTGMRVERFSIGFGPLLLKRTRGETEYGIAPIPLGGYVRITGMNPEESLPPDVAPRAYYHQPVWKRVVVIMAGPAVNLLIAFFIF